MILSTHLFCLLNLNTTPQLCPYLLLAYTFDVLDLILQHNQPKYYSLFTMHDLLCTINYALCIIHYALCIIHYALYTMHYALCTMHYALCIHIYIYSYIFIILYVFIRIYYFMWKSGYIPRFWYSCVALVV